jgi:hypothetical protein
MIKQANTLRERLKNAKNLLKNTYETTIIFEVVCGLNDKLPIDFFDTIKDARECIKGINEYYVENEGTGIKLFIRPIVVDDDSYEPLTEENLKYYSLDSDWVKTYKKEREEFLENLKNGIMS